MLMANIQTSDEYKKLTNALEILEQQRKTRENDIDSLKTLYQQALKDPIQFVEKLIGGSIKLPGKQSIHEVPFISWLNNGNDYNHTLSSSSSSSKRNSLPSTLSTTSSSSSISTSSSSITTPTKIMMMSSDDETGEGGDKTKKRKDHSERDTASFKQSWTEDEQRKLNKLLIDFPPEEVAAHRWKKIADALGNRTPKQVASRTQKYFIKLHRLGLPIPGKAPNPPSLFPNKPIKKKRKKIDEDDDQDLKSSDQPLKKKKGDKKKSKTKKLDSSSSSTTTNTTTIDTSVIHEGYKCDGCNQEPIIGVRWKCEECMEDVDLCQSCHDKYDEIGSHKSSHHMAMFKQPIEIDYYLDDDYKFSYGGGTTNYLDPNFKS